jgi:8-oxo-dGTP pyrophosphatase MutT (NUDIX family)
MRRCSRVREARRVSGGEPGRWLVHGERLVYENEWLNLALTDVELPSGQRFDHHVVRTTAPAVGVVVSDPARGVLLLWRHRFITDSWGYEVPAGRVDEGETLEQAAAREAYEETGWRPGPLSPLCRFHPTNGLSDQTFHVFRADGAEWVGDPPDPDEATRVEWVDLAQLRELIAGGAVLDGLSLTALLWHLTFGGRP